MSSTTPPPRPHKWFTITLGVLLVVCVLGRYVKLEMDAPYGIVSTSGAFLTDEGFYSKSAQLYAKFGEWTHPQDLIWRSHNSLFTAIQAGVFSLFGVSLAVARAISVTSLVISMAAFYGICRSLQSRTIALVSCLLVAITLQNFAYSRMALIEPVGTAFSLVALWVWVRFPGRWWTAPLSMLIVGCAVFAKVSFIYAAVAVGLLNIGEALLGLRRRAGTPAADDAGAEPTARPPAMRWIWPIACVAVIAGLLYVIQGWVLEWSAADGALFKKWHVDSRVNSLGVAKIIKVAAYELKAIYKLCYATGASALTCSLGFGVVFLLLKKRVTRERIFGLNRATVAMILWCAGGVSFFGLFEGQPPRYFFFALFPVVFVCVTLAREVAGERHWRLACLYILFLHTAIQVPGYLQWSQRRGAGGDDMGLHTYREHAYAIMRAMEFRRDGEPTVLMGGTAAFVALFSEHIRPVSYSPYDEDLADRMGYWRPRYLLARRGHASMATDQCPDLIATATVIEAFPLLHNYYGGEDHVLMELTYKDAE